MYSIYTYSLHSVSVRAVSRRNGRTDKYYEPVSGSMKGRARVYTRKI